MDLQEAADEPGQDRESPRRRCGWVLLGPWRAFGVLTLLATALSGFLLVGQAFRATMACCGTPEENWLQHAWDPAFWCGLALMAVALIGALWLAAPMYHARAVLATVLSVAVVLAGVGAGAPYYRYRRTEAAEVTILRRLAPPAGATDDRTTLGSEPGNDPDDATSYEGGLQAALAAGPFNAGSPYDVPTAVRSWRVPAGANACGQTAAIAKQWEPLLDKTGPCDLNGGNREFGFWAYVVNGGQAGEYAVFWLAPDAFH
jgi:hypothetical protein